MTLKFIHCWPADLRTSAPGDGQPARLYTFHGHADIRELAAFFQDNITIKNWTFNLGVRFDHYDGITSANQAEPRLGIAYNIKPTNTVLRDFLCPHARDAVQRKPGAGEQRLQRSGGERSHGHAFRVIPASRQPLRPGWRNEFHAGLQQAFGKYFVIDAEYIWKYTHLAYDFSVLGNTPITFPDRVGEFQDPRLRGARQHAEFSRAVGVRGVFERRSPLF